MENYRRENRELIRIRGARQSDARSVFSWRNDPWIIALGASGRSVSWEEHRQWFEETLESSDRALFIAESEEGEGMGTLRLERINEAEVVLTIYLLEAFVGHGRGPVAICRGVELALETWSEVRVIRAEIRAENERSRKAFARCGFVEEIDQGGNSKDTFEMVYRVDDHRGRSPQPNVRDDAGRERLESAYLPMLKKFPDGHQAVGWGSRESQKLRFEVLAEVGNLEGASILDVGCGIGDFVGYLEESGFAGSYHGIDRLPEMVARATGRFPSHSFSVRDLVAEGREGEFDFVTASGIFTFADQAILEEVVAAMYRACRVGVAFNSLSARAPDQEPNEFNADPQEVERFCRGLSSEVVVRHDYLPHDFTVYLYKGKRAS